MAAGSFGARFPPPDASLAADWQAGWAAGIAPRTFFDGGAPHPLLLRLAPRLLARGGVALVPGCGRGYDVAALAALPRVAALGMELAPSAAAAAGEYLASGGAPPRGVGSLAAVVARDFFDGAAQLPPPFDALSSGFFDLVVDYTFLCALPPGRRAEWGSRMAALVAPGGALFCLQFPLASPPGRAADDRVTGPPFLLTLEDYHVALAAAFDLEEAGEVPPADSPPGRAPERFAIYRRR